MNFADYTHPDDRLEDEQLYASQARGEIENYSLRKRIVRPDGTVRYLDAFSSSVRDASGQFRYGVRVTQDVTETKQMQDRIRESEQHMRDLLEALPAAIYTTDPSGCITFYNKAAIEMAGRTPQSGDEWCVTWKLYWPDGTPLPHNECPMAIALKENRPVRGSEAIAERPDGSRVPFIPYPTPLYDASGKMIGAINMLVDITERKRAENAQKLLIDELNHRVKNTLATVQSLASQTARHSGSVKDFTSRFERRLLALARAHDLLSRRNWQSAPFAGLVHDIIAPADGDDRVSIEGPHIELDARTALSLTMVLNELLTNAAKYGSLSSPQGSLAVRWMAGGKGEQRILEFDWRESGGPEVVPPRHRGFGTRLMERCVERDLAGQFDLGFEEDGLRCRFSIPIRAEPRHG